jgi:glycosyltransferase involved in cell wall biosynthesis
MLIQRGFPPERVTCIPHFTESVRESGYAAGPRGYLLYFGRLSAVKGVRTLVMAMRELQGVVLKIVGDGPQRAELERLAQQVRADGGIQFHGRKVGQELEELISGARAVIVPSEFYETFGLTCIESFAWGKPVIASRLGSLPEIVREGENGLLFRPGDAADLGAAVSRLLRDTPLASSMGRRNQAAVQEKYLPEAHYRRLLGIYDLVLASKRGGSAHSNTAGK